jgi:hypothetical protein
LNPDLYKAVVRLTNTSELARYQSLGSGVVFGHTGLVLTNNHVIEDGNFGTAFGKITVESLQSVSTPPSNAVPAEVIIRNETYDLAIVRIEGAPPTNFIDLLSAPPVDALLMEKRVRILGYPPLGGGTLTVTRGIVSGFDEAGNLKTDAEINPGNSGGAALDESDQFLGIPSFISGDAQGKIGFIISLNRIKEWLGTVLKSGIPQTAEQMAAAFIDSNLNFSGDNVDQSNSYPRILSKFAAVERLLAQNEYEKVIPHVEFILAKRPRSALAYHYLGNALLGLGRYLEAAAQFRAALVYDPDHVPTLGNYGLVLTHLGRQTEAVQIFERIIDSSADAAELHSSYLNLEAVYKEWGKADLAKIYRQKADQLEAAATEVRAQYKNRGPKDRVAALADALMQVEMIDDQKE